MKKIDQLKLKEKEREALEELKGKLSERFPDIEVILYGSKARGDDKEFSDIDLLILLKEEVNTNVKREIIGLAFDIELEYDIVFGLLIEESRFWSSALAKAMPIHWNVDKEGIRV